MQVIKKFFKELVVLCSVIALLGTMVVAYNAHKAIERVENVVEVFEERVAYADSLLNEVTTIYVNAIKLYSSSSGVLKENALLQAQLDSSKTYLDLAREHAKNALYETVKTIRVKKQE